MGGYHQFYEGAKYGSEGESAYASNFVGLNYSVSPSNIGLTTDARTANQLKAVSDKLNTGAKVIEVQGVSAGVLEYMPDQHIDEINRLRKLAGTELTFHGPLVEATGINPEAGRWDAMEQKKAELQALSAVQRGQRLNPEGNTVITFHTTAALPEMETTMKGEKEVKVIYAFNDYTGRIQGIPAQPNYLLKKDKPDAKTFLDEINEEQWSQKLSQASFHAYRGKTELESIEKSLKDPAIKEKVNIETLQRIYKNREEPEIKSFLTEVKKDNPEIYKLIEHDLTIINHVDLNVREAYSQLQELYNLAYSAAKVSNNQNSKEDMKRLEEYRDHLAPLINSKELKDPEKIGQLAEEVTKGMQLLSTLSEKPKTFRPLQDVAIEKASETFSNVAFKAFKEFKENTPIISLENPPAGGGISRGEEIAKLVTETRNKFVEQAMKDSSLKLSKEEARKQAEKLIGVTWDVGHINMLRRYGYEDDDLVEETKKVAPMIKHIHLSDNFGLEHTELPMGMGNVPTKKHLELIKQYNDKAKMIVETGGWYQHFQKSPLAESFAALGSPIYGSGQSWSQTSGLQGGYFSGYGMNPDVHHSLYGAGFSNLPVELGGQMAGKSRVSGNPME